MAVVYSFTWAANLDFFVLAVRYLVCVLVSLDIS